MTLNFKTKLLMLQDRTLSPQDFSHIDHIGVSYEALRHHPFFDALSIITNGIRDLTIRAKVPDKFNATITFAYMSIIAQRMETSEHETAQDFIKDNPDLMNEPILTHWYSKQCLSSTMARTIPLMPDIVTATP